METSNGLSNLRSSQHRGSPLLLPPNMAYETEFFSHSNESFTEHKEGLRRHQRTYSDSMLIDQETPCWVQELLDEPETPIFRSHRRSSSDSIAYFELGPRAEELDATRSDKFEKQNAANPQGSFMQHRCLHPNPSSNRTDSKRAKRHSAQHYRARKVQYIAELERSVQVLHAEGYEVSAELEFLDQQNLILGMENRALKQRLDSLSQEQFIKSLEQEMLEKEIARLRNLYQQQQQKQQQKHHGKPRSKYQNLEASFAKLSLKNKGTTELQKALQKELPSISY